MHTIPSTSIAAVAASAAATAAATSLSYNAATLSSSAVSSYIALPPGFRVGCSGCNYKHWHVSNQRPKNFYNFKGPKKEYEHYAGK